MEPEARTPRSLLQPQPALAVAGGLILAAVVLAALWLLSRPTALLLSAVVLAAAMAGPARLLTGRLSRTVAILLAYALLALAIGGLGWFVADRLLAGANGLGTIIPQAIERAQAMIAQWDPAIGGQVARAADSAQAGLADEMVELPGLVIVSVTEAALVLVMSIYCLVAADDLLAFALSLFPPARRPKVESVLREMADTMGGYVRANAIDAFAIGAAVYAGLLLIGVPYALPLAIVAMVGELIPLVGPFIAAVPILAVAVMAGPVEALATLVLLVALKQVESYLLLPHLTQREAAIPPLLAIFALVAGASVGHLLGAIVAVPLAGALRVLVVRVVAPAIRRRTGAEAALRPPREDLDRAAA